MTGRQFSALVAPPLVLFRLPLDSHDMINFAFRPVISFLVAINPSRSQYIDSSKSIYKAVPNIRFFGMYYVQNSFLTVILNTIIIHRITASILHLAILKIFLRNRTSIDICSCKTTVKILLQNVHFSFTVDSCPKMLCNTKVQSGDKHFLKSVKKGRKVTTGRPD